MGTGLSYHKLVTCRLQSRHPPPPAWMGSSSPCTCKCSSIKPVAPHLPPPWQALEAEGGMHAAPAAQTMHKGAAAEPVLGAAPSGVATEVAMAQAVVVVPPPTQVLE